MSAGRAPTGAYFPGSGRKPIEHGTTGGYRAHFRHGEPMCEPCRHADREQHGSRPFRAARCGTRSGYHRHLRSGEAPCEPCRTANTEERRAYEMRGRGDVWPYEHLIPAAADLAARGCTRDEIAEKLSVSKLRVGRALARARRASGARTS